MDTSMDDMRFSVQMQKSLTRLGPEDRVILVGDARLSIGR
jgi:hypothetical protein